MSDVQPSWDPDDLGHRRARARAARTSAFRPPGGHRRDRPRSGGRGDGPPPPDFRHRGAPAGAVDDRYVDDRDHRHIHVRAQEHVDDDGSYRQHEYAHLHDGADHHDDRPVHPGDHRPGEYRPDLRSGLSVAARLLREHADHHNGCSWCVDYGYYESLQRGQDPTKVRDVPIWRNSTAYSDAERTVLEYAESASATPVVVDEDLVRRLHEHFTDEQIVEFAAWVALENYRSRFNGGLGLQSEGFSDACRVPGTGEATRS